MSNTKSAAFACSATEYEQIKAVAAAQDKSISAFIRDIVWPHVEIYHRDLRHADEIKSEIRQVYKRGGMTIDDLCLLYNKNAEQIRLILKGD